MGHFHYEVLAATRLDQVPTLKETPKKNYHSHICEALEYAVTQYAPLKKVEEDSSHIVNFFSQDKSHSRSKRWKTNL